MENIQQFLNDGFFDFAANLKEVHTQIKTLDEEYKVQYTNYKAIRGKLKEQAEYLLKEFNEASAKIQPKQ